MNRPTILGYSYIILPIVVIPQMVRSCVGRGFNDASDRDYRTLVDEEYHHSRKPTTRKLADDQSKKPEIKEGIGLHTYTAVHSATNNPSDSIRVLS